MRCDVEAERVNVFPHTKTTLLVKGIGYVVTITMEKRHLGLCKCPHGNRSGDYFCNRNRVMDLIQKIFIPGRDRRFNHKIDEEPYSGNGIQ